MGGGGWNHGKPKIVLGLEQITLTFLELKCLQVYRLQMKTYGDINFNLCNVMLLELPQDNQKVRMGGGGTWRNETAVVTVRKQTQVNRHEGRPLNKESLLAFMN